MTWIAALTIGAGAGLVFFDGLWLTIRASLTSPRRRTVPALSFLVRLALVAVAFVGLSREAPATFSPAWWGYCSHAAFLSPIWEGSVMGGEHFKPAVLLRLGPVEVTSTVLYSLAVSGVVIAFALVVRRGIKSGGSRWQTVAESVMEHLEGVLGDMSGVDPRPYTPLIVTLALFIGVANLLGLVPEMRAPTADFSTTVALAMIVFLAVPFYGIKARGVRGYLGHYLEPSPLLLPLEIITELSRTLALSVRLFGNVMSEELIIAVLLGIAGLFVPVPIMMLAVLTGIVQAYIFAVLTAVYLSAALRAHAS